MKIRVGFGFDVHQLREGRPCILGGVEITHSKGPLGHSDADVLIHAICDALLGAAGLRDIGFHFPDTSAEFKGADSKKLLARVMELIREKGFEPGNIDCTLVAEQPKINPHINAMKETLGKVMSIETDDIAIKATTNEKMGFIGREEGVTAYAVALLVKK
ncbi:MAG: 2-C-methyl-D-erythritol 2,4-cyclodiphosphate synthase [Bacteroidia bacterium]|nr:2-C-methyl-D-erythritol 2,4-cyclodiphosphate synthase [Bacteroidota bacterium]MBK9048728.1 2-C-methyl-D-erythritol 2,4-cyclodiphosphate synthase [Bacteroidota bacterium]MBK9424257.1 2-C-methyl-D-erythritol 2,4-cyclodiphosphate synthase [Bacteroidota bacterium]MBP9084304.1 2-C-methyl-D-erythritol 2,4-cyclodiphosphate synthase [Bacteroidia bacterium]